MDVELVARVALAVSDERHAEVRELGVTGRKPRVLAIDRVAWLVDVDRKEVAAAVLNPRAPLAAHPHREGVVHAPASDVGHMGKDEVDRVEAEQRALIRQRVDELGALSAGAAFRGIVVGPGRLDVGRRVAGAPRVRIRGVFENDARRADREGEHQWRATEEG